MFEKINICMKHYSRHFVLEILFGFHQRLNETIVTIEASRERLSIETIKASRKF